MTQPPWTLTWQKLTLPRKEIPTIMRNRNGLEAKDAASDANKRGTSKGIALRSHNMMQQRTIAGKGNLPHQVGHEVQKLLNPQRKMTMES